MKKILLSLLAIGGVTPAFSQYESLQLSTLSGENYFMALPGLSITFADATLKAVTGSGATQEIPLADMKSMQFSSEEAGVAAITPSVQNPAEVFDLSGVSFGTFSSLGEIHSSLPGGTYILNFADGSKSKILIKK